MKLKINKREKKTRDKKEKLHRLLMELGPFIIDIDGSRRYWMERLAKELNLEERKKEDTEKARINIMENVKFISFGTEREKWAWLGAFIDAECSIGLYKNKCKGGKGWFWVPRLAAKSTTPILLVQARRACNGGNIWSVAVRGNRKPQKFFSVHSKTLRYILPNVLPFLCAKRKNAELLLEALELIGKRRIEDDENRLEQIYRALQVLNKRGNSGSNES